MFLLSMNTVLFMERIEIHDILFLLNYITIPNM